MTNEEKAAELSANKALIARQSNLYHTNVYDVETFCFNHADLIKQFLDGAEWKEQQMLTKISDFLNSIGRGQQFGRFERKLKGEDKD